MKIKEADLAKKVVVWLIDQKWDVYQEVQGQTHGPCADIGEKTDEC